MKKISARWRNLYTKASFPALWPSLLAILCGLVVGFVVLLVADPANALLRPAGHSDGQPFRHEKPGAGAAAATPIILTGLSGGFANKTRPVQHRRVRPSSSWAHMWPVLMGVKWVHRPAVCRLACLLGAMLAGRGVDCSGL